MDNRACYNMSKSEEDTRLHKLCHDGSVEKVKSFAEQLGSVDVLADKLAAKKGVFGYTPLHEAVAGGNHEVLDYLLTTVSFAPVNGRAGSGYTLLHLAASSGHISCLRVLLKNGADISITDDFGKTPKQTAELSGKGRAVQILRSEEIIKEVQSNGDNLTALLRFNADQLEPNCLNHALVEAVKNDNHFNVGKLVVKGANNLEECLQMSKIEKKPHARAMLLMVKAAMEGNQALIQKLFGEPDAAEIDESQVDGFEDVQKAVLGGKVSTIVPIEIARRNGHSVVRKELLLKTDVNQEEGSVYWHGLRLLVLDVSWLQEIHWVKRLRLARNGFRSLPNEIGSYLQQVVKLDLQHNELTQIPHCLLELPSLSELNLSHNKLSDIPDVPEWSSSLAVLDLSFNSLQTLPLSAMAPSIRALNISHNQLRTVPLCICSFTSLHLLDLSDNPDIQTLPAELGKLASLTRLHLRGLKDLKDPPRNIQRDTRDCIRYLSHKLDSK